MATLSFGMGASVTTEATAKSTIGTLAGTGIAGTVTEASCGEVCVFAATLGIGSGLDEADLLLDDVFGASAGLLDGLNAAGLTGGIGFVDAIDVADLVAVAASDALDDAPEDAAVVEDGTGFTGNAVRLGGGTGFLDPGSARLLARIRSVFGSFAEDGMRGGDFLVSAACIEVARGASLAAVELENYRS